MADKKTTTAKLAELKGLLAGKSTMLIVLQDNPDPDALAAAFALKKLANSLAGVQCSIACGGTVGRGENRAMVRYLDLNLRRVDQLDLSRFDLLAMVDTQPGQGNNSLPADVLPHVLIDHHPLRPASRSVGFADVRRRYGSTSTILWEYLRQASIELDPPLATALLYGIRSDTQDLGREAIQADKDAYGELYPLANKRMLGTIQRGEVPSEYFQMLATALDKAQLCGRCIYCDLGLVSDPDMISEMADLLLRHEQAHSSLCWGYHGGRALLSVRTDSADLRADAIMHRIVRRLGTGGGHETMAGGQVVLKDPPVRHQARLDRLIPRRFLEATGNESAACTKLL